MQKKIIDIVKKMTGNVIGIGLNEILVESISKNADIVNCNLLDSYSKEEVGKGKSKTIKIKKIRRYFKKKKVNYIICNYEVITKYMNTFVKDSIYITNKMIVFYGQLDEEIIKKYKRYNCLITSDKNIIKIDTTKAKNNFFKDTFYYLSDSLMKLIIIIGDSLMN
ncbi:MAG: hypothetical protein RSB71_03035 [Bacilli bacterium]